MRTLRPTARSSRHSSGFVSLLCQVGRGRDAVGIVEEVVDAAGEVAFEVADGFAFGFAVGALSGEVDGGAWIGADADDCEHVEGAVESSVAAGVEAVAVGASGGDGDWGAAGEAGELGVGAKAVDPGDLADEFGREEHADPGFGQQLRRDLL